MNAIDKPVLPESFKEILRKNRQENIMKRQYKDNQGEKFYQARYFSVLKDLTILAGTVLASIIALSGGSPQNSYFLAGAYLLFLATLVGILNLWSEVRSAEWTYFFNQRNELQGDLILYKQIMDELEVNIINDTIESFNKIINRKGVSYSILKIIRIDWLPTIFFSFLILGLYLILFSLKFGY